MSSLSPNPLFVDFVVQRSGWTKDLDIFLQWLSTMCFSGGGFSEAAIAEGLSEALMMFPVSINASDNHQIPEVQKHCILVAASNPYPLPTPVYRPPVSSLEHKENTEVQTESFLADAETVAKSFSQCFVSLSLSFGRKSSKGKGSQQMAANAWKKTVDLLQRCRDTSRFYMKKSSEWNLPVPWLNSVPPSFRVKAILGGIGQNKARGKKNPRAADPSVDHVRNPQFLVLLSETFVEACAALSRSLLPNQSISNQGIGKIDGSSAGSISGLPATANPSEDDAWHCRLIASLGLGVISAYAFRSRNVSSSKGLSSSASTKRKRSSAQTSLVNEEEINLNDEIEEEDTDGYKSSNGGDNVELDNEDEEDVYFDLLTFNGTMMPRQPITVGSIPTATVKVEPMTVSSMVSGPGFSHVSSITNVPQVVSNLQNSSPSHSSQEMNANIDTTQEIKPLLNPLSQPLRAAVPAPANVNILNTISQHRTPVAVHMSNMISSGMASSAHSTISSVPGSGPPMAMSQVAQNSPLGSLASVNSNLGGNSSIGIPPTLMGLSASNVGQGTLTSGAQISQVGITINQNMINNLVSSSVSSGPGTMIPTPGMSQQSGSHSLEVANNIAINMPLAQQAPNIQQSQSKYVKIWEVVFFSFLTQSINYSLAADWPPAMQIVRLIAQDHMNNKYFLNFLVFRTLNQHGFLGQLQEKKLCAVIQLPSQTLLLSVSDKAGRLIGMLFPGVSSATFSLAFFSQKTPRHALPRPSSRGRHPRSRRLLGVALLLAAASHAQEDSSVCPPLPFLVVASLARRRLLRQPSLAPTRLSQAASLGETQLGFPSLSLAATVLVQKLLPMKLPAYLGFPTLSFLHYCYIREHAKRLNILEKNDTPLSELSKSLTQIQCTFIYFLLVNSYLIARISLKTFNFAWFLQARTRVWM
ncbi:hypothetical protein ZIOFF_009852 [Zingiber officinale]|uniref:Mediator of RNA polymerase II transcription subunit 25 n=1 Tax=Zingiber officinale TaxID=94328 RepID=A0A8J5HHY4_ZINOF|nr:hypothetical protein ZIOFF_009852 [Zingiber officinale]